MALAMITVLMLCANYAWPLSFLAILSAGQVLLELAVRATDAGRLNTSLRNDVQSNSVSARLISLFKELQGFSSECLFEYRRIGGNWKPYFLVFIAWRVSLQMHSTLVKDEPGPLTVRQGLEALLVSRHTSRALILTMLCKLSPLHCLFRAYNGREGDIHGFGWNLYYKGDCRGQHFDGERFFALDWHQEKLVERGPEGQWKPRSEMRTVFWPHVHMCFWSLEFWPWVREPTGV